MTEILEPSVPVVLDVPAASHAAAPSSRDAERVARILAGDEATFLELVEELHEGLIRLAMLFVRRRDLAEEVVQDTWVAVLEGLKRFEGRASLKTWISRILTNQAKTRAVREARSVPFSSLAEAAEREIGEQQASVEPERFHADHDFLRLQIAGHWKDPPRSWRGSSAEAQLTASETMAFVRAELERLPEVQRAVVTLRDVEGWTSEEVCASLGLSEVNQRVLLHRGRSRVRRALEAHLDEGDGPSRSQAAKTTR